MQKNGLEKFLEFNDVQGWCPLRTSEAYRPKNLGNEFVTSTNCLPIIYHRLKEVDQCLSLSTLRHS